MNIRQTANRLSGRRSGPEGTADLRSASPAKGGETGIPCFSSLPVSHHLVERGTNLLPARSRAASQPRCDGIGMRPNLMAAAQQYLDRHGTGVDDLFHHFLAPLHNSGYLTSHARALTVARPRIPLPGWPNGQQEGAADQIGPIGGARPGTRAAAPSETPAPG